MLTRSTLAATLLSALAAALPAGAWEFTPGVPCLLTHDTNDVFVELTYDPTAPLYTISLTTKAPFAGGPVFSIRFAGPSALTISTSQHRLSNGGRTLTVTDRGFGNVLNGLQFNQSFIATLGPQEIRVPLTGAATPVADFRACDIVPAA